MNEAVPEGTDVAPARGRGKSVGRVVGIVVIVAIVAAALLGVGS
ncbi:MAG TPA: hypothetical protein VE913_00695 [Longimicrobium sp.]|nr:hypothetical protein [Longimicrobium sp.]